MAAFLKRALERRLPPGQRPEGARAARPALRAAAKLRPLHRHQGRSALSAVRNPALAPLRAALARRCPWPSPSAAARFHRAAACRRAPRWPGQVHALHVHHGLQPAADDFARHCEPATLCAARLPVVPLHVVRSMPGTSPAKARKTLRARRRAMRALADGAATHGHRVGTAGAACRRPGRDHCCWPSAAAPACRAGGDAARFERDGMQFAAAAAGACRGRRSRAWLRAASGVALHRRPDQRRHALTRNRIRADVWPALRGAFPHARRARRAAAAHRRAALLDELAATTCGASAPAPRLAALARTAAGAMNALRHWLRATAAAPASLSSAAARSSSHGARALADRGGSCAASRLLGRAAPARAERRRRWRELST